MKMSTLMMGSQVDGHYVGYAEACAVPTPQATRSWCPAPNKFVIDTVRRGIQREINLPILKEEYGLSRKDQQLFGVLTLDSGDAERNPVIGLRSSLDKSLAGAIAAGARMCVCDNLDFGGDGVTHFRKHTTNFMEDFERLVGRALRDALGHYARQCRTLDAMKTVPMRLDAGYEFIGRALGHDIIKPQQATIVFKDWREPRHEEFSDRNLHSLYQCFTEGLKKGPAGGTLDRYAKAREFFAPHIPAAPIAPVGWRYVE